MITQVYQRAWDQLIARPVPWILFNAVFLAVGTFIPLIGALALMPNLIRETTAAIEEDRDPDLGALFDTRSLSEDLGGMLLYGGAQLVGLLMCLIGWPIAWVLFWLTPEIRADRMVGAVDAMKLSAAFVISHLGEVLAMILINSLLISLGSGAMGLGVLLATPIITLSWSTYLIATRPELNALAQSRGLPMLQEVV
ncbi:MAG: hypothetical protein ACI8RZ_003133 [Myxococcota bacterium]|jgi:hypothetical protein